MHRTHHTRSLPRKTSRTREQICWIRTDAVGVEHLLLDARAADGVIVGVDDEHGPFRLAYGLAWNDAWELRRAELHVVTRGGPRALQLTRDARGRWFDKAGRVIAALDGCTDLDLWPTPLTNTFPIRRVPMRIGQRREFTVAWIDGLTLGVSAKRQAYTRVTKTRYQFESLDHTRFMAELEVDSEGLVREYEGLFRRLG